MLLRNLVIDKFKIGVQTRHGVFLMNCRDGGMPINRKGGGDIGCAD